MAFWRQAVGDLPKTWAIFPSFKTVLGRCLSASRLRRLVFVVVDFFVADDARISKAS